MTPTQMKAIQRDLARNSEGQLPVCAFSLRNGQILTGNWLPLSPANQVLVVSLINKEAPPIYIDVVAVDAIAVGGVS